VDKFCAHCIVLFCNFSVPLIVKKSCVFNKKTIMLSSVPQMLKKQGFEDEANNTRLNKEDAQGSNLCSKYQSMTFVVIF